MKIAIGWLLLVGWEVENGAAAVCCQVRYRNCHTHGFPPQKNVSAYKYEFPAKKGTATCNRNYFHGGKKTVFLQMCGTAYA